ncbi:MAG: replicative DNA helicase, partial [Candidatus Eisenbacteria bacterium]|nr:replicative DNA helicase [Candidatus Eisenbacteria bacterium]
LEVITSAAFYRASHRYLFESMVSLWEQNEAIDLITVGDALKKADKFEAVGGATYLAGLLNEVATAANVEFHAQLIKEKATLRQIIETCTTLSARAYEDREEASGLLDEAEKAMFAISNAQLRQGFIHAKDMINPTIKMIEKLYEEKKAVTGLETGFLDFDHMTSGLQPGDLVIVAGRPSMGKTSLAMNMAANVALRVKKPVGVFSLEMGTEQLLMRLLCSEARVSAHRLRTGYLRDSEWPLLISSAGQLSEAPLYIDDSAGINVLEVRAKARRLHAEVGLGMIVIDYLQLLSGAGRGENRQQEISEISRSLKALAKELKVPVVALSQLSRAVEARTDHRPMLSDLRESGAIEQDADVVCFVYREEHYKRTDENEGMGEIIIGKQRNGPIGSVKVAFIGEYTRFENLSREELEPF